MQVGAAGRFATLRDALQAAQDGDTIALQPGTYAADVGVAGQRGLRIVGLGSGALLRADGRHAEGKAILVVRGDVQIDNLEFRGTRVASGNGAGIRFESGRLQVLRCRFFDNENGILAANTADMELDVVDCEFGAAPRHAGLLHHLLYAGSIGRLHVSGSRFSGGWRGHLLKSRARSNRIVANIIDDGPGGEASYELEFPNGGDNLVLGNLIGQGAASQNAAIVSMGAEGGGQPGSRLVLAHNTFFNRSGGDAEFVKVWTSRLQAPTLARVANNVFIGPGGLVADGAAAGAGGVLVGGSVGGIVGSIGSDGNVRAGTADLRDAAALDFRPAAHAAWRDAAIALPPGWTPDAEFTQPVGTRTPAAGQRRSPGAFPSG